MKYTCPVCGYNELPLPPEDWLICACCNTKFGYSDVSWEIDELRQDWITRGARWGSVEIRRPKFWSPIEQLKNINYFVTNKDKISIARASGDFDFVRVQMDNIVLVREYVKGFSGNQPNIVIRSQTQEPQASVTEYSKLVWQPVI